MLSSQFYDNEAAELRDIINGLETDLLDNISKTVGKNEAAFNKMNDAATKKAREKIANNWRVEKLKELGGLNEANITRIARTANIQADEIESILRSATKTILDQKEGVLKSASELGFLKQAPPLSKSKGIQRIIKNITRITKLDFNRLNKTMLVSADKSYRKLINQVTSEVIAGTNTGQTALKKFINGLADDGLTAFVDKAGRTWSPQAYGDLLIRSNTKESAKLATLERANEYGNDYIEVSSHSDARPKCADDQGKIYSLSGDTRPIKDLDGNTLTVHDWGSSTNGEVDGIMGANCTHQIYNFVPNFSTRTFDTTREIDKKSKKEKKLSNEKQYAQREKQRELERRIKTSKEKIIMHDNTGNESAKLKAQNTLYNNQRQMDKFIDDTGRVRRNDREQLRTTKTGNRVTTQPRGIKPVTTTSTKTTTISKAQPKQTTKTTKPTVKTTSNLSLTKDQQEKANKKVTTIRDSQARTFIAKETGKTVEQVKQAEAEFRTKHPRRKVDIDTIINILK